MKAMPALPATDVAPRTGQTARKVADGESGKHESDFTQVLRKRENSERSAPGRTEKGTGDDSAAAPAGLVKGNVKGNGGAFVAEAGFSTPMMGSGEVATPGTPVRRRHAERQGETPSDSPSPIGMQEGTAAPTGLLSGLPQQVVPTAVSRQGEGAERNGTPETNVRSALSVDAAREPGEMADTGGEMAVSSPSGEKEMEHAQSMLRKNSAQDGGKMRIELPSGDDRMPVKVVSVSVERHLEPVNAAAPGGRDGMWQSAAAQVLRALDEGLLPQALTGLDGAGPGGPKLVRNLEIQLHPASLGTVTARLTINGGNMEITISVPDRRLADQMERGLDQLVRRIRAHDHGNGQTVVHLVTEPQHHGVDRLQQQMPGQPASDGRSSFGAQTREGAPGGGHGGRDGHGGAQSHDGRGGSHDGARNPESVRRAARRDGLLYL